MANTTYGSPYVQSSDLVSGWPATSLSVADRIDDVSFKGNGVNNQTATYTTVLTDAGKTIVMNVGSANDLTIQASGTAAYETGTMMRIVNKGSGATTVKPAGGVTLNGGNITLAQNQSATVVNLATDVWSPVATPAAAGGLALVATSSFSAVSSVNINNCFTSTYANYKVLITVTAASANSFVFARLRASGTDSSASYYTAITGLTTANGAKPIYSANDNTAYIMETSTGAPVSSAELTITSPQLAQYSVINVLAGSNNNSAIWTGYAGSVAHAVSSAYDGITIYTSGTFAGSIRVYGYQNS